MNAQRHTPSPWMPLAYPPAGVLELRQAHDNVGTAGRGVRNGLQPKANLLVQLRQAIRSAITTVGQNRIAAISQPILVAGFRAEPSCVRGWFV